MSIVSELEAIIEEAEQGHFSLEDLKDLVAKNQMALELRKKQLLVRTVEGVIPYTDIVVVFTGTVEDGVDNESGFYEHFSKELSVWASERGFECHIDEVLGI